MSEPDGPAAEGDEPLPERPPRIGLAFSGGGFRATAFHLGVLSYLREQKLLSHVTHICSVSGGSILAGHLCVKWSDYAGPKFEEAAGKLTAFLRCGVRARLMRRALWLYPLKFLLTNRIAKVVWLDRLANKLFPYGGIRSGILIRWLNTLYGGRMLHRLEGKCPQAYVLATNVRTGTQSAFMPTGIVPDLPDPSLEGGVYSTTKVSVGMLKLSVAVAASASFPGVLRPIQLTNKMLGLNIGDRLRDQGELFADGGISENTGTQLMRAVFAEAASVEPAERGLGPDEPPDIVIVSDASTPLRHADDTTMGALAAAFRAPDILMGRVGSLERSATHLRRCGEAQTNRFLFMDIDDVDIGPDPVLNVNIQRQLPFIRTDLDKFSALEVNSLALHGWAIARKMHRCALGQQMLPPPIHAESSAEQDGGSAGPWMPLPNARKVVRDIDDATIDKRVKELTASRKNRTIVPDIRDGFFWLNVILSLLLLTLGGIAAFNALKEKRHFFDLRIEYAQFDRKLREVLAQSNRHKAAWKRLTQLLPQLGQPRSTAFHRELLRHLPIPLKRTPFQKALDAHGDEISNGRNRQVLIAYVRAVRAGTEEIDTYENDKRRTEDHRALIRAFRRWVQDPNIVKDEPGADLLLELTARMQIRAALPRDAAFTLYEKDIRQVCRLLLVNASEGADTKSAVGEALLLDGNRWDSEDVSVGTATLEDFTSGVTRAEGQHTKTVWELRANWITSNRFTLRVTIVREGRRHTLVIHMTRDWDFPDRFTGEIEDEVIAGKSIRIGKLVLTEK